MTRLRRFQAVSLAIPTQWHSNTENVHTIAFCDRVQSFFCGCFRVGPLTGTAFLPFLSERGQGMSSLPRPLLLFSSQQHEHITSQFLHRHVGYLPRSPIINFRFTCKKRIIFIPIIIASHLPDERSRGSLKTRTRPKQNKQNSTGSKEQSPPHPFLKLL